MSRGSFLQIEIVCLSKFNVWLFFDDTKFLEEFGSHQEQKSVMLSHAIKKDLIYGFLGRVVDNKEGDTINC